MTYDLKGDFDFWSQQSCGNDTNVPTWVWVRQIKSLLLLSAYEIKNGFMQINLELRTPTLVASTYISISLRVLYKVLMALSLAIQMARLWRGVPGWWTAGCLRQLGSPPFVKRCLWSRWTATTFKFRCVIYSWSLDQLLYEDWIMRSLVVRQLWFVINDVLWYQSIMSRKNNLPGIAMYGMIGIWD